MEKYDLRDPTHRELFRQKCNEYYKAQSLVVLKTAPPLRSGEQNRYLHVLLGLVAHEIGESKEYVKNNVFKILCNRELFVKEITVEDERLTVIRSTSEISKKDMKTAIQRFINWAERELSDIGHPFRLPDADRDKELIPYAELQIEKWEQYNV